MIGHIQFAAFLCKFYSILIASCWWVGCALLLNRNSQLVNLSIDWPMLSCDAVADGKSAARIEWRATRTRHSAYSHQSRRRSSISQIWKQRILVFFFFSLIIYNIVIINLITERSNFFFAASRSLSTMLSVGGGVNGRGFLRYGRMYGNRGL